MRPCCWARRQPRRLPVVGFSALMMQRERRHIATVAQMIWPPRIPSRRAQRHRWSPVLVIRCRSRSSTTRLHVRLPCEQGFRLDAGEPDIDPPHKPFRSSGDHRSRCQRHHEPSVVRHAGAQVVPAARCGVVPEVHVPPIWARRGRGCNGDTSRPRHSVALGWPVPAWVIQIVRLASSMPYQMRPPEVTSYCHCSISTPLTTH